MAEHYFFGSPLRHAIIIANSFKKLITFGKSMKSAKDWFSRRRQNRDVLPSLFFKTICSNRRIKIVAKAKAVLTALVALKMMSGVAFAQNTWFGTSGSNWFFGLNWSLDHSPTANDSALINTSFFAPTVVDQPGAVAGQLTVSNNPPGSTAPGSLTIESPGVLTIGSPGSAVPGPGGLDVESFGNPGAGTMMVTGGGLVNDSFADIALNTGSAGTVTVDGTNSKWTNLGGVFVGYSGTGTLTIQNGGKVIDSIGYIGLAPTSSGTVTVTGPGATWINSNNLIVGRSGTGTLTIENGGLVVNSVPQYSLLNFPRRQERSTLVRHPAPIQSCRAHSKPLR